jgi:hypothetical protein
LSKAHPGKPAAAEIGSIGKTSWEETKSAEEEHDHYQPILLHIVLRYYYSLPGWVSR